MSSEIRLHHFSGTREEEVLFQAIDEATPRLESGLKVYAETGDAPRELQLRMTKCGMATAALQQWLREQYDVETERLIARADLSVEDLSRSRRVSHVLLRTTGGTYIDPTYSQFYAHVGLTHRAAVAQDKVSLYPSRKIAVFSDHDAFAKEYADQVRQVDMFGNVEIGGAETGADGAFRGASKEAMIDFYTRLWSPDSAEPFLLEDQKPWFQETAKQIFKSMKLKDDV